MGDQTKIEWCDMTFNPWIGCTKISAGCQNCYALDLMETRYQRVKWGPQGTRQRTSDANWRKPLAWNRKAEQEGRRYRVFCASLADVFEDRPELAPWRADLLQMIIKTPHLDWLLLTKRPENVNRMIEQATGFSDSEMWFHAAQNVWIGTSVENQAAADERIPHLLSIPARVRFLSCEPLLGSVDIGHAIPCGYYCDPVGPDGYGHHDHPFWTPQIASPIDWVIVGGESGHNARHMDEDWVRSLRDQCVSAGVAFFYKQSVIDGKKVGLPFLDGKQWNESPQ